jgi:hypothetical protein
MSLAPVDGGAAGGGASEAYTLVGSLRTFRVRADNTTQPIQQVTAQSKQYGVTYTWFIDGHTWDTDSGPPLIADKTGYVNEICGHAHVQGFRTEQDQDQSQLLENFAVITVGTDDGSVTDEARVHMDTLETQAPYTAIDAVWKRLVAAGAS